MKNTKVFVKESSIVRPSKETPKRTLWLSSLDMLPYTPSNHATCLYVYHYDPSTTNKETPIFFDPSLLKESLAHILVPFYPMAGRFKEDPGVDHNIGRPAINCNGEGVLFIEAEINTHSIADFGDFKPTPELKKLLFPYCDYSKGVSSFPLMMIQLTRFSCGGVTLALANSHLVGDGYAFVNMTNSWSKLARGLDPDFMPVHDRANYFSPRNPPQVKFQHDLEYEPPKQLLLGDLGRIMSLGEDIPTQSVFKFTKDQVVALKQKVTSCKAVRNQRLSTYEVLAGHIWRTACKARGLVDDQEVRLYIPLDGRALLALPQGYCGNVVFFPACIAKSGDITANPLWYAALKIHETMVKVKNEDYLRSSIDYLETHPNLNSLVRGDQQTLRCPNMSVNSWGKLPLYEADFGWGRPKFVSRGGIGREGQSYLSSNPEGDGGFTLCLSLFSSHMLLFEKYLYEF